jgi:hypothetical protein
MGLSLRKRIKISPGIYANIGVSGVSFSISLGKGCSVNMSKKGTYANTSIPGTGIRKRVKIK